jgi:hypothetical protein
MRAAALLAAGIGALAAVEVRAQTTYGYTGGTQTYTVPAGMNSLRIKTWGAGGGAAANISGPYGAGGGGGFVQADIAVTAGETITVVVGQGGAGWNSTEGFAGGTYPNGGNATNFGGGGGGRTEVSGTNFDLVAAGGGGGGYQFNGNAGQGGVGGASTGGNGGSSPNNAGGLGGSQSSGGSGGSGDCSAGSAGGSRSGGAANGADVPGGSGGDGYYGGGGGGGGLTNSGDSGGGGGGGSNYTTGSALTNVLSYAGSGSNPGNTTDPTWVSSGYSTMGGFGAGVGSTTAEYRGGSGEVSITATAASPVITSALSLACNQGQTISPYQITASGSPTGYGASGLPTGLSINTSTGVISGTLATNSGVASSNATISSTITATNYAGSGSATLVWHLTAAQINDSGSVAPSTVVLGQSVTLTRNATTNFGVAWTESTIWPPSGSPISLGNAALGSTVYTPASGSGVYTWQFRVVDIYSNYLDQWIPFTVDSEPVTAPSSVSASIVGSTFVALTWSGATAQAGIAYYNLYRNGVLIGTANSTSYTDTVSFNTSYAYTVQTVDWLGNISSLSQAFNVTTAPDFEVFTPLTPAVAPSGPFYLDNFAGSAGTVLSGHASDSGATYSVEPLDPSQTEATLTGSGGLNTDTAPSYAGDDADYIVNANPPSANYTLTAKVTVNTANCYFALGVRYQSNGNCYLFKYQPGDSVLVKIAGGSWIQLYENSYFVPTVGSHTLSLSANGSTLTVTVDGTVAMSATDSSITAPGTPFLQIFCDPSTGQAGDYVIHQLSAQ